MGEDAKGVGRADISGLVDLLMRDRDVRKGFIARMDELISSRGDALKRDGAALADGLGGSIKETIIAMAVVARYSGLLGFALVLGDDDFAKLVDCLPDDEAARAYVRETGHLRMVTCNGLTLVSRGPTR